MSLKWVFGIWECQVRDNIRATTIKRDRLKEELEQCETELKWQAESLASIADAKVKLGYTE